MSSDRGKSHGTRDYSVENFSSPPRMVVRSPLFENNPRRNHLVNVRPSSLRDVSVSSDGELPPGWRTAEEQQRILLSRKYLSPGSKPSAEGFATSSDEDCSRSWKTAKRSYPGVQFAITELERHRHLQEHLVTERLTDTKGRRRLSEGSYSLGYGDCNAVPSRNSDSDIFGRGMKKITSFQLVEEGQKAPETRVEVCRNIPSLSTEGARCENVLDVPEEDSSESELKRTRMESTGSEIYTKQRRSKIRVLEESEDLNIEWKDATACGAGSGGIGRGRIVKGKELCTADGGDSYQHLVRESHSEVGKMRITDDQEDFIQKCGKWSVADSYINVDGKLVPRKLGRFEYGSDRESETHDNKAHRRASLESALDVRKCCKWSKISDPMTILPKNCVPKVDTNNDSATDHSSSDLDSKTDLRSLKRDEVSGVKEKDVGQRFSLIRESRVNGKAPHDQPECRSRRKSSADGRCTLSQGSDTAKSCHKESSSIESDTKTRKARYDIATSVATTDRVKDVTGASLKELRKKGKSIRKRRSQSPTAAVACAASMIGDTVDAVRKVRENAAELAFKFAELHAHDAKALRSAAAVMRHHVDSLHTEVHSFQASYDRKDHVEFPWHSFLKEFLVAASLVSGVFSVHACINSVRKALGSLKQTANRREKLALAAVLLTVGFGTSVYHGLGQVKSVRRIRDKQLRVHLKCIMERTSLLSTLAHTDPTSSPFETFTDVEDDRQSIVYSR